MESYFKLSLGFIFILFSLPVYWIVQNVSVQQQIIPTLQKTKTDSSLRTNNLLNSIMFQRVSSNEETLAQWSLNETAVDTGSVDYCRPVKKILQGVEGEVNKSYTLLNVHVVIRHGERTTMYNLPSVNNPHISCQFEQSITGDSLSAQYLEWVKNNELGPHSKYPTGDTCKTAQLTPRGLVQQIYNGMYLGKVYRMPLFDETSWSKQGNDMKKIHKTKDKIYARTTEYSRTFQSSLGFLYGLTSQLPNTHTPYKLVRGSPFTNVCSAKLAQESCSCRALETGNIDELFRDDNKTEDDITNKDKTHKLKEELGKVLGISAGKIQWLGMSLEVFMGYACQGHLLPCIKDTGKCVTKELLRKLWNAIESKSNSTYVSDKERLKSMLHVHPLLQEIAYRLLNITRKISSPKFVLYSGHDKTLTPLAIALGVHDGKWPPYASRLVIELYAKDYHYFIRVLYNGRDLTASLDFCEELHDGLCSLGHFLKFVFSGFNHYGYNSYSKLCNAKI